MDDVKKKVLSVWFLMCVECSGEKDSVVWVFLHCKEVKWEVFNYFFYCINARTLLLPDQGFIV